MDISDIASESDLVELRKKVSALLDYLGLEISSCLNKYERRHCKLGEPECVYCNNLEYVVKKVE